MQKVCGYYLGNFGEKLGNFLFHHLVTLVLIQMDLPKEEQWFQQSALDTS